MAITLLVITMVSYTMMRLAPGDPTRARGLGSEEQAIATTEHGELTGIDRVLREKYHLDKHPLVGYCYWLRDLVTRFDWGTSIVVDPGAAVTRVIAERLPPTLKLNVISILLIYASAIPIGIFAALKRGKLSERVVTVLLFILYSMPAFWVGLILLMLLTTPEFMGRLGFRALPVAGLSPDLSRMWGVSYWRILLETARYYIMPVFCLTYGGLAGLSRYARMGILEIIRQDYVRTARAKGLPEWRVILKHVFRNSLIPLITLFAGLLPGLIAGSIIVEHIFSIPGVGSLSFLALTSRDYPLMMALFTIGAILSLLGILVSDLLYAAVDPRITFE